MGFKSERVMPKKKTDTEKKDKESKAVKSAPKKAPIKAEKKVKATPAPAAVPAPAVVPPAVAAMPKSPSAPPAEKPKLTLPKKPAQIKRAALTITVEDISLRAYFIAERRKGLGWPGDETSDWVEAERQLLSEATKKQR